MKIEQATPAQREAITTDAEDVVALAGPGSGKTATLVARIARLFESGVPPSEIAVMTFTNAAARELAERIDAALSADPRPCRENPEAPALGFIGTLHAFALRMLKEHGAAGGYGDRIALISPESATDLLASKAKTLGCKSSMKHLLQIKAEGPRKDRLYDLNDLVVRSYLDDMRTAGIVDYDGLLMEFERLLQDEAFSYEIGKRFSFLFVDEVQDSAPIDWRIYHSLPMRWRFYVGDPDQAIYSFRGGRVDEMIEHAKQRGTLVIKLQENFRSREEICTAAQWLIEHNRSRLEKRTTSVRGAGGTVETWGPFENEGEEIAHVARTIKRLEEPNALDRPEAPWPFSVAVLGRTNAIIDGFRRQLPSLGVPVVETKRNKLPTDWMCARSFMELRVDPDNDALAFFYAIARQERDGVAPKLARERAHAWRKAAAAKGISLNSEALHFTPIRNPQNAIEALTAEGASRESRAIIAEKFRELPKGSSMLDLVLALSDVREYVSEEQGEGVHVLTIHAAKGREFDVVFLVGFEDEAIPGRAAKGDFPQDGIEEERRLAYVAITRARRELHISGTKTRSSEWSGVQPRHPSRFLAEIGP